MGSLTHKLKTAFPVTPKMQSYLDCDINETLIRELLAGKDSRIKHILGVVAACETIIGTGTNNSKFREDLIFAGWAHDIGYAPALKLTGFHPIDGAAFLAHKGIKEEIIRAVLFHTGARETAIACNDKFPLAASFYINGRLTAPTLDALCNAITYCDLRTGPNGERLTIEERIRDIENRYGVENPLAKTLRQLAPNFKKFGSHFRLPGLAQLGGEAPKRPALEKLS